VLIFKKGDYSTMKKLFLVFVFLALFSNIVFANAPFHIGVLTNTVSQSEDELRGAEWMLKEYGSVSEGGYINHLTLPDNFMTEMETTISLITSYADDPLMKAIVVNEAIPGIVEGFRRVREIRPDILLFAGNPHEDPVMVSSVADLSVYTDNISRGYLAVLEAKKLGAENYVFITFPRHLSMELISRMKSIKEVACQDLGLNFYVVGAPDPTSDVGVAGAQQFLLEKVPTWVEQYGQKTAFFSTNASHHEPLIKRVVEHGGIYIEAQRGTPTMGYPGALGVEFAEEDRGNWPKIVKKIEEKVVEMGASGRIACWAYSFAYSMSTGLTEHAKRVIEGTAELLNKDDIMDSIGKHTGDAKWNGSYYVDANDVEQKNFLLIYQDTYVFGKGYLNLTSEVIPEKYYDRDIGKK
jgi:hypothetical protein